MRDILIVEDGPQERERLASVLSAAGFSVVACEAVSVAEEELKKQSFRLAILDIGLADKSGSHLFNTIRRHSSVSYVIIFTGNPSPHLRQRLMDEGASDYIVKGSPEASSEGILQRVRDLIGEPQAPQSESGIDLLEFLDRFVSSSSQLLFKDDENELPTCKGCSGRQYRVVFDREPQVPPNVKGVVVCAKCDQPLDIELA